MLSKTLKGGLVYTHKIINLHILQVIFGTQKWWELAGEKETLRLSQEGIYYFCMKMEFSST